MHLRPSSIIKITVKKMAITPECFGCFQWDLQNWKKKSLLIWKVSTNYLSQTLSSPNVSEDTNVTLLPKRELFFLNMSIYSKMLPVSYTNTHHDVTDLLNRRMAKTTRTWISWECNITSLQKKKKKLSTCASLLGVIVLLQR